MSYEAIENMLPALRAIMVKPFRSRRHPCRLRHEQRNRLLARQEQLVPQLFDGVIDRMCAHWIRVDAAAVAAERRIPCVDVYRDRSDGLQRSQQGILIAALHIGGARVGANHFGRFEAARGVRIDGGAVDAALIGDLGPSGSRLGMCNRPSSARRAKRP